MPVKQHIHGKTPKSSCTKKSTKITPEQLEAIKEELKLLPELIRTHYTKWTNGTKDFKWECMEAQKLGKEILCSHRRGNNGYRCGPSSPVIKPGEGDTNGVPTPIPP
jgi:hypothetical protein